jgi:hypothetical protein
VPRQTRHLISASFRLIHRSGLGRKLSLAISRYSARSSVGVEDSGGQIDHGGTSAIRRALKVLLVDILMGIPNHNEVSLLCISREAQNKHEIP